ncbi:MAG TPA: hypothetical protein GX696_11140 [Pseudomonadaceae bacterium]|nr:hypothetical protein [Pseudomonadaceae bacterium]
MPRTLPGRSIAAVLLLSASSVSLAHHGFGLFQMQTDAEWSGTLTRMELVNPHSYMYFDTVDSNGEARSMRCEMRAATLIRRMGWSTDMFVVGAHVQMQGHPHRDDPDACYIEEFTLDDGPAVNRNQMFSSGETLDTSDRPLTLASGEPNISGDWAVEQAILTVPPSGGTGALVPVSVQDAYAKGDISLEEIRARNPAVQARAVYTEEGQAAADAFRTWSVEDNPRLSCQPTSILFDWTFDWPVNRITQHTTAGGDQVIDMDYGLFSFSRRIHMDQDSHPTDIEPSNTGHSIGHWEDDTLVVDTVGFSAGVLSPPTRNSEQLHVVERFTLDPGTFSLQREYIATDPVYLAQPYQGTDIVLLSSVPYEKHPCVELTPEFENN